MQFIKYLQSNHLTSLRRNYTASINLIYKVWQRWDNQHTAQGLRELASSQHKVHCLCPLVSCLILTHDSTGPVDPTTAQHFSE